MPVTNKAVRTECAVWQTMSNQKAGKDQALHDPLTSQKSL